jgi:hypothetical protein
LWRLWRDWWRSVEALRLHSRQPRENGAMESRRENEPWVNSKDREACAEAWRHHTAVIHHDLGRPVKVIEAGAPTPVIEDGAGGHS